MGKQNRVVGRNAIQQVFVRITQVIGFRGFIPFFLVPATANDPLTGLGEFDGRIQSMQGFIPVGYRHQVDIAQKIAQSVNMSVAFNKTRHYKHAVAINNLGFISRIQFGRIIGANIYYFAGAYRNRLSIGPVSVHGVHGGIYNNGISHLFGGGITRHQSCYAKSRKE